MAAPSVESSVVIEEGTLIEAASVQVWSETGKSVTFGSLFEDQKTIVVFIRHFLCGMCKIYVEELGKVPQSSLDAAGTRIVVIGCGEWPVIKQYRADANDYPYEIYAEPTRSLHRLFGLRYGRREPNADEERKGYVSSSVLGVAITSVLRGLRKGYNFSKVGDTNQLGGDFVLGPGLNVTFGWRMRNSQDHVEIDDLMKAAGVAYSTGTP